MSLATIIRERVGRPGVSNIIAILGMVVAFVGAGLVFASIAADRRVTDLKELQTQRAIETQRQMQRLVETLELLQRSLRSSVQSPNNVQELDVRLRQVERSIGAIERSLVETPERALSVPMMRRDLAALEANVQKDLQSLREDIGRLYTAIMWLIGIIVTLALGLLGLLIARKSSAG